MNKQSFLLVLFILFTGCSSSTQGIGSSRVCFKATCFKVELADTEDKRMRGLQHRQEMPRDQGMLFIFPFAAKYGFWMKDTLIPLDIIWLDYKKEVVYISPNVPPCISDPCPSYIPDKDAMYVLELNAGKVKEFGITIHKKLEFLIAH